MPSDPTVETLALVAEFNDPTVKIVAHLAKNAFPHDMGSVLLADFIECDFPGYAPIEIEEFLPGETSDPNQGKIASSYLDWIVGKILVPQLISAVYLTIQRTGGQVGLFYLYFLDSPITVSFEGQRYVKAVEISSVDTSGI